MGYIEKLVEQRRAFLEAERIRQVIAVATQREPENIRIRNSVFLHIYSVDASGTKVTKLYGPSAGHHIRIVRLESRNPLMGEESETTTVICYPFVGVLKEKGAKKLQGAKVAEDDVETGATVDNLRNLAHAIAGILSEGAQPNDPEVLQRILEVAPQYGISREQFEQAYIAARQLDEKDYQDRVQLAEERLGVHVTSPSLSTAGADSPTTKRRAQWGKMHKRMNSAEFFAEQPYAAETRDAARRMEHRPRRSGRQGRRSNRNSKRRMKQNVYNRTAARKQYGARARKRSTTRNDRRRKRERGKRVPSIPRRL